MDLDQLNSLGESLVRAGSAMCNVGLAMMIGGTTCIALNYFGVRTGPKLRDHDVAGALVGCVALAILVILWDPKSSN